MLEDWNLPQLQQGRPAEQGLVDRRASMEASIAGREKLHEERPHIARHNTSKGGVGCIELGASDAPATVIYLHGGGFSLGHPRMWERYGARLADETGVRVVLPRYRMAPENPFPAALHDVVSVFVAVQNEQPGKPVVVMGESAGATLTASLLAAAAASGQPFPDGAIIISPVMDFSSSPDTSDSHADVDPWVSRESLKVLGDNYLQGHDPHDPLASSIFADMSGYPPIQLFCGGREVLLGDALTFARKLALANRNAEVQFIADAEHGWTFVKPLSPPAEMTMAHIVRFIRANCFCRSADSGL
jgi:monoterpene epsilon-lactone hydrolase